LMHAFIDSQNNLSRFSLGVKEIEKEIEKGINDYQEVKRYNQELLDNEE
jgi:hypothetical protein